MVTCPSPPRWRAAMVSPAARTPLPGATSAVATLSRASKADLQSRHDRDLSHHLAGYEVTPIIASPRRGSAGWTYPPRDLPPEGLHPRSSAGPGTRTTANGRPGRGPYTHGCQGPRRYRLGSSTLRQMKPSGFSNSLMSATTGMKPRLELEGAGSRRGDQHPAGAQQDDMAATFFHTGSGRSVRSRGHSSV